MPSDLRTAHQKNDRAVMEAYGMTKVVDGKRTWLTESETVARLFEMYEELKKSTSMRSIFCIIDFDLWYFIQKLCIFGADMIILRAFQFFPLTTYHLNS